MKIDATNKTTQQINHYLSQNEECEVHHLLGQRYLGNALTKGHYIFYGYPGNVLGGFLDGAEIELYGNAQEACGNTMSGGRLVIHGHCGDALAYGMRGGEIYVDGNCGSRCGVHMKQYHHLHSVLVIGGSAGDFLGEYNAGGTILVLNQFHKPLPFGRFCGAGAHGGTIYFRLDNVSNDPRFRQVDPEQLQKINQLIDHFAYYMKRDPMHLKEGIFYQLEIPQINPYEGLYVKN